MQDVVSVQGDTEAVEAGAESAAVVLLHGPDTAYYTIRPTDQHFQPVRVELDTALQEELEALKLRAQAQEEEIPTRWVFQGQALFMKDKGGSQFKWILHNDFLTLAIGRGKKTGIVGQVRLSSEYLWSCGGDLGLALSQVHVFLTAIYGQRFVLEQSALDLAADVVLLDVSSWNVKEGFLSRAVYDEVRPVMLDEGYEDGYRDGPCVIRRRWKRIAGLAFGQHTSVVSAVIYNKTDEIKYHSPHKRWFYDLWRRAAQEKGVPFDESMTVWRVEVRFRRDAFREFPEVSGAYEVLDHVRDLWTYAVGHAGGGEDGLPDGWLRYVVPGADTNRARWPVHPDWQVIQRAFDEEPGSLQAMLTEEEREREEREAYLRMVDEELEARPWRASSKRKRCSRRKWGLPEPVSRAMEPSPLDQAPLDIRPFVRKRKRQVNLEKAAEQVCGWLTTWAAWEAGDERDRATEEVEEERVDDLSMVLYRYVQWMQVNAPERLLMFTEEVYRKRVRDKLVLPSAVSGGGSSGKTRRQIA